jgi:hypothetical protein
MWDRGFSKPYGPQQHVRVRVTLRLTVSESVCLGVELTLRTFDLILLHFQELYIYSYNNNIIYMQYNNIVLIIIIYIVIYIYKEPYETL